MGEESGPITRACQRCGVAVSAGYLKCPRCHAELPVARVRRAATDGGGTAMTGSGNRTVLLLGGAAIAVVGLVIWLLVRDPSDGAAAPVVADAAPDDQGGEVEAGPDDEPAPPDRPPAPNPTPAANDGAASLAELARELRGERLWATVTAAGDAVVIDSSFCEDPGLLAIVDKHVGDLLAARYSSVRCRAPHGGVIFDRGL